MELDLSTIWRRRGTLLLCALVGLGGGFGYLCLVPPTYLAQARVLVEPQGVSPEMEMRGRVDPEFLPTQAETIRSPVTIRKALKSVSVRPPSGISATEFDPVRHVLKSLQVTPILKANVVTVSYRSSDTTEAEQLIASIVEAYRQHVAELDRGATRASTEVVAARERSLRQDLEAAQREYDALRRSSPLVGQGRDANAQAVIELNRLGNQLAATWARRAELEAMLNLVTSENAPGATDGEPRVAERHEVSLTRRPLTNDIENVARFAQATEAQLLQDVQDQYRFAKLRLQQLDATLGPRHPEMIAAQTELQELAIRMNQRIGEIVAGWRSQLQVAVQTVKELERSYKSKQRDAKSAEAFLVREEFLKGNIERIESLHAATAAQLAQMQSTEQAIAGGRSSIDVRILDGPVVLSEMTWPNPKLFLPAAGCLGLVFGLCLVLVGEMRPLGPASTGPAARPSAATTATTATGVTETESSHAATDRAEGGANS